MIAWELLGRARVPGNDGVLSLFKRDRELSIRMDGCEIMNSRQHGSEEALAELACARITDRQVARVLIGGLGMGFTLAAALRGLGAGSRVEVAELVPAVVVWNRGVLAHLAGHPLADDRVTVREEDVVRILKRARGAYDAVLLDVDNGPDGLTSKGNGWIYGREGLGAVFAALRPSGVLGVWSAGPDRTFAGRLRRAGFAADEIRVRARASGKGARHTIWIAVRGASVQQNRPGV
jgi:spermidine synthase